MRPQYHFRQSPQGLCAWNVHRLVTISFTLPLERVPLSAIRELDEPYWSGEPTKSITCRQIAEHARLIHDSDLAFPVILSSGGRVMDGMHRICKALLEGLSGIEAVRFLQDPEPTTSAYIPTIFHTTINPPALQSRNCRGPNTTACRRFARRYLCKKNQIA